MNRRTVQWGTIVTDLLLINLAFMLAYVARYVWQWFLPVTFLEPYSRYVGQQLVLTGLLALTFQTTGVWRRRGDSWLEEVARAGTATAAGITLMMAVTFFFQPAPFSRLLIFWALLFIVLFLAVARLVRRLLEAAPVHTVFIALPGEMHRQLLSLMQVSQQHGARVQVVPDLLQLSLNRVEFSNMGGIPVLGVRDMATYGHMSRANRLFKRALDLVVVTVLAVPALVVMAVVAIAIRLDSGGPVLYTSPRVGRDGRPFAMYKFRSMVVGADEQKEALRALNEADGPLFKIRHDPRLTPVGRVIRRLSLDELPQLYNIVRGQMSLVGPRPPLPEEVAAYKPWHRQRLAVVGGLTGLWQVSGRSDLTFDELCLLDIYYIENWSLGLDVRILLQTIPHLLSRKGAY